MYSKLQIKCLQELGIKPLSLKPDFAALADALANKDSDAISQAHSEVLQPEKLDWQTQAQELLTDLLSLFPNLQIDSDKLHLTNELTWELKTDEALTTSQSCICSDLPETLSIQDKRQIWQHLQQFLIQ